VGSSSLFNGAGLGAGERESLNEPKRSQDQIYGALETTRVIEGLWLNIRNLHAAARIGSGG
jgi:hypothetical protein